MSEYVIMTDSCCDLPADVAEDLKIVVMPMVVDLNGHEYVNYLDWRQISMGDFYDRMRAGDSTKTSALNQTQFAEAMEKLLADGKDILYLGFSSGLSSTVSAGEMAARELRERYPDRKICVVDSLCASMGQGLFVYLVARKKSEGLDIEALEKYASELRHSVCHWFTVDDLMFLKRGGRISGSTALIGTALGIKPILHVDEEGHLINVGKVRGRKRAVAELMSHMEDSKLDDNTVFISHGDCIEDAELLRNMVMSKYPESEVIISGIGPVIGGHSGPGTLALFFLGSKR